MPLWVIWIIVTEIERAQALEIYGTCEPDDTETIAANLRAAGLNEFAEALETGCYAGLAI